jgi:hypothetical protein
MRRLLAVLPALILSALPAVASAEASQRYVDERTGLICQLLAEDGGAISIFVDVSTQFFTEAHLLYLAPQEDDLATYVTGSSSVELADDGSSLIATFNLHAYDPFSETGIGEPVGPAVLAAAFTPLGDPVAFSFEDSGSNAQMIASTVQQSLNVSGEVALPAGAGTFDLATCAATTSTTTVFSTHPDTFVNLSQFLTLTCSWELPDGFAVLQASGDQTNHSTELFVLDASGTYFGSTEGTLSRTRFGATYELTSDSGTTTTATAEATLSPDGDHQEESIRDGDFMQTTLIQALRADGTLAVATADGEYALPLDGDACSASHQRVIFRVSSPSSP